MKTWSRVLLYALVVALAAEVVVLAARSRQQRRLIQELVDGEAQRPPGLRAGDSLPVASLTLRSAEGAEATLAFGEGEPLRLLYVFNTRCPVCRETLPSWRRLAGALEERAEVVALTSDPLADVEAYARDNDLGAPAFRIEGPRYSAALGVDFVPHTILVSPTGTVLGVWPGALDRDQEGRVQSLAGGWSGILTQDKEENDEETADLRSGPAAGARSAVLRVCGDPGGGGGGAVRPVL